MTVQELNTFHFLCESERNQLLTKLARSIQNLQLTGLFLTGTLGSFLSVGGATDSRYDCPQFLSPLYKANRCFDCIFMHYKDSLMSILLHDEITTVLLL